MGIKRQPRCFTCCKLRIKRKKNTNPKCDVANELASRTYGEKKWWVVIVKDE